MKAIVSVTRPDPGEELWFQKDERDHRYEKGAGDRLDRDLGNGG